MLRGLVCYVATRAAWLLVLFAGWLTRRLAGIQAARAIREAAIDLDTASRNLRRW